MGRTAPPRMLGDHEHWWGHRKDKSMAEGGPLLLFDRTVWLQDASFG